MKENMQEVIHREQNDHDPIDVVQLKKDVPVVIEEMRKPTPKKLTSTENEKIRTIRTKNTKQNQENTYARQYTKPKENRTERLTTRSTGWASTRDYLCVDCTYTMGKRAEGIQEEQEPSTSTPQQEW